MKTMWVKEKLMVYYHFLSSHSIFELFTFQSQLITTLTKNAWENTVGKGEDAGNQHFLLFPQCFLFYQWEKDRHCSNV